MVVAVIVLSCAVALVVLLLVTSKCVDLDVRAGQLFAAGTRRGTWVLAGLAKLTDTRSIIQSETAPSDTV